MTNEDLIQELGIEAFTPEEQTNIIDKFQIEIGEALSEGLSEQQLAEYQSIIDGDQEVIDTWLAANAPDYKDTIAYKEFAIGFEEDPDQVPADKVFASMAWVQQHSPNLNDTIESIKRTFKANPAEYK